MVSTSKTVQEHKESIYLQIERTRKCKLTFDFCTSVKGIPSIAGRATTDRVVSDYLTSSVQAASARTRVNTLLIDARLVQGTLGANKAFGSTGRWSTHESGLTRADRVFIYLTANAVRTAG